MLMRDTISSRVEATMVVGEGGVWYNALTSAGYMIEIRKKQIVLHCRVHAPSLYSLLPGKVPVHLFLFCVVNDNAQDAGIDQEEE